MTWNEWFEFLGAGILFGVIWVWFWIWGRINQQSVFFKNDSPKWMRIITGISNPKYTPTTFTINFPKAIGIIGFLGSMVIVQLYQVIPRFSSDAATIIKAETSFPLFMTLTSLILVMIVERKLKKVQTND